MTFNGSFLADFGCYYSYTPFTVLEAEFIALKKRLNLSENELLDLLCKELELKTSSPKKTKERILSRISLRNLLGVDLGADLKKLQFNDQYQLKNLPAVSCSLSHCPLGVACVATLGTSFLGIDVEAMDRTLDVKSLKYFTHESDNPENNLLKLWVKKEAAFKAINHYQNFYKTEKKITGLHEIVVKDLEFFFPEGSGRLKIMIDQTNNIIMSVALITA